MGHTIVRSAGSAAFIRRMFMDTVAEASAARKKMRTKTIPLLLTLVILSLSLSLASMPTNASTRYVPKQGDYFNYHEIIDVNNGLGYYGTYTDHTVTDGGETMNAHYSNGTVATHYSFSWSFSNSSGYHNTGGSSGNFTYSSTTFYYEKG